MAAKHKSHGKHSERRTGVEPKSRSVGSDYPNERFTNPLNQGLSHYSGNEHDKTIYSPSSTIEGADLPLHEGVYDNLWKKGK